MDSSEPVVDPWEADAANSRSYEPRKLICRPGDVVLTVNSRYIGKIIGKGGSVIKGLKRQSGAFISILDNQDRSATVKISGSEEAKKLAKKLINNIVNANGLESFSNLSLAEDHTKKDDDHTEKNDDDHTEKNDDDHTEKNDDFIIEWDDLRKRSEENVKKRIAALPPIVKNYYKEHAEVTALSDKQVERFRLSMNNIMVKYVEDNASVSIPKPVLKFSHAFSDYPEIMNEIVKQKFETPSPVQCQAWPIIMSGHDLIAIAQTGTGKTLAFLLPAFIHVECQSTPREQRKGPTVLILAPTRELVAQIENEVQKYSYKGIKSTSIYGGANIEKQKESLLNGVEIVIATPGRLNDFLTRKYIDLSDVSFLILDEADRMLDLGFEPQIRLSLLSIRPNRQTIMTSATWPMGVKGLAKSYTTNPIQLVIGSLDLATVNTVKQEIIFIKEEEKEMWIEDFVTNLKEDDKVIIFVNRKVTVDYLSINLALKYIEVDSIHGGREQCDREQSLENVRSGNSRILIATDVASRGIDIDDVTIVINYDLTKDIGEYVHRVGRTGRAGKTGLAITLMTKYDWAKSQDLINVMEKSGQEIPQELRDMAKKFKDKLQKNKSVNGNRPFRGRGSNYGDGKFYINY